MAATTTKKVLTEDLGKMFEMAICLYYDTPYDGTYKYSLAEAHSLKNRLGNLKNVFPYNIRHCARYGSKYDFECVDNPLIHLSAKTSKNKTGKVCPQVLGQPSRKKFCEFFALDQSIGLDQIKLFISNNIANLLQVYSAHTFDCPILYYNKTSDLLAFIVLKQEINWSNYTNSINFSHNIKKKLWNESSSISINGVTIGEFQVHNNRDCIKFRWAFENLLAVFGQHFTIVAL